MFAITPFVMTIKFWWQNWNLGGNTEYFDVPDKTVNKLKTKKKLDREQPLPVPYVIVFTSNDCTNKPPIQPCSEIDTALPQYLNVSIKVIFF